MFWHVHHDYLCEYCYDYDERVRYIKKNKPENEVKTRLRLMKPVKGKLPKEFVEADKKRDEAWKKRDEAWKKWDEAYEKREEACKKWEEAYRKYLPELEKLHKKECGCKEWNGRKIVFLKKEEDEKQLF